MTQTWLSTLSSQKPHTIAKEQRVPCESDRTETGFPFDCDRTETGLLSGSDRTEIEVSCEWQEGDLRENSRFHTRHSHLPWEPICFSQLLAGGTAVAPGWRASQCVLCCHSLKSDCLEVCFQGVRMKGNWGGASGCLRSFCSHWWVTQFLDFRLCPSLLKIIKVCDLFLRCSYLFINNIGMQSKLKRYKLLYFFETETYYVAQTDLEIVIVLPQPPSARLSCMHNYTQLKRNALL